MKITYKFATGEVTEVEVSEEIGTVILESRKAEHACNERHRYHTAMSTDALMYEDAEYFGTVDSPESLYVQGEETNHREFLLSQLTAVQRRRFEMLMSGMTIADIARAENASFNSVKETIEGARKKLKKYF